MRYDPNVGGSTGLPDRISVLFSGSPSLTDRVSEEHPEGIEPTV